MPVRRYRCPDHQVDMQWLPARHLGQDTTRYVCPRCYRGIRSWPRSVRRANMLPARHREAQNVRT